MGWVWSQNHIRGSTKLLLLALAEHANHFTGLAYPSIEQLIDMTGQDRKTVIAGFQKLIAAGAMEDTGKKVGKTGQIPVYRLLLPPEEEQSQKRHSKRVPNFPAKSPVFPSKESQKRDTEPSKEPSKGTDSNHYDDERVPTDLFGEPILTPEQQMAQLKARTIEAIEEGWNRLAAEIPTVAALRGGKLDDARADTAFQRAEKFAAEGEAALDVWTAIFREIRSSRWLCGETPPRDGRPPFRLQLTWLLEHRNFTKVLEGKFGDGRDPEIPGGGDSRRSPAGAALGVVLDRRRAGRIRRAGRGSGRGAVAG